MTFQLHTTKDATRRRNNPFAQEYSTHTWEENI
jgi:hypothetical protein